MNNFINEKDLRKNAQVLACEIINFAILKRYLFLTHHKYFAKRRFIKACLYLTRNLKASIENVNHFSESEAGHFLKLLILIEDQISKAANEYEKLSNNRPDKVKNRLLEIMNLIEEAQTCFELEINPELLKNINEARKDWAEQNMEKFGKIITYSAS